MLQEVWSDDLVVHDDAAVVGDRSHAPDEEDALEEPVERNHLRDVEREELEHREDGVDHPVGEPLCVVGLVGALDGLHGDVGGVGDSNHVAEDLGGIAEGEVECDESNQA